MQYGHNCTARPRHRKGDPAHHVECVDHDQLDLLAQPVPSPWAPGSPAARFEAYHAANPAVFDVIVAEARRWKREYPGRKLGINLLIGRVRWVLTLKLQADEDGYKINDHVAPYYARLVIYRCPDLRGLFTLRASADADAWIVDLARREGQDVA